MLNLIWTPLAIHFALMIGVGGVLIFGASRSTSRVDGARFTLVDMLPHVMAAVLVWLAFDAWRRDLANVFLVFPLLFLALYVALFLVPSQAGRRFASRGTSVLAHSATRLTLLIAGLAGFFAMVSYSALVTDVDFGSTAEEKALDDRISQFVDDPNSPYVTDRDRPVRIRTFVGEASASLERDLQRHQKLILSRADLQQQIITVTPAWLPCNCHGFVFAESRYWIPGEEVAAILEDNDYMPIDQADIGDLAVYRNLSNEIVHTGVVRGWAGEVCLVESKWGKLGCFLHPHRVFMNPNVTCVFYRSPREGHALKRAINRSN